MGKEYHIHVDAQKIDEDFEQFLTAKLELRIADFIVEETQNERYAPERHLSGKYYSVKEYNQKYDAIITYINERPESMVGYVEGEFIAADIDIPYSDYQESSPTPYRIEKRKLNSGEFRENEIHITLEREKSDQRLLQSLRDMGYFSVGMQKKTGLFEIFTIQGSNQAIENVLSDTVNFLNNTGGAYCCSLKEERIISYKIVGANVQLPPVIDRILKN